MACHDNGKAINVDGVMWVWGLKSTNLSRDVLSDLDEPLLGCSVNSYF